MGKHGKRLNGGMITPYLMLISLSLDLFLPPPQVAGTDTESQVPWKHQLTSVLRLS